VHGDVHPGITDRLARRREPAGVSELREDRHRGQLTDPEVTHQRLAAGLTARIRPQLLVHRSKLSVERVDHPKCDGDLRRLRSGTRCRTWSSEVSPPVPAPLEANDSARARTLKAKIRDRVGDVRRHLIALRTAMAEFGEDFDLTAFQHAYDPDDPVLLNQVKAVERGVDQLYNYVAELAAFGLELVEVRARHQETNARADIDALRRVGVIGSERARRLQRLRELRRLLVHEYAPLPQSRCTKPRASSPASSCPSTMPTATGSHADLSQSGRHDVPTLRPGDRALRLNGDGVKAASPCARLCPCSGAPSLTARCSRRGRSRAAGSAPRGCPAGGTCGRSQAAEAWGV
jgi:hypothetical protein